MAPLPRIWKEKDTLEIASLKVTEAMSRVIDEKLGVIGDGVELHSAGSIVQNEEGRVVPSVGRISRTEKSIIETSVGRTLDAKACIEMSLLSHYCQ